LDGLVLHLGKTLVEVFYNDLYVDCGLLKRFRSNRPAALAQRRACSTQTAPFGACRAGSGGRAPSIQSGQRSLPELLYPPEPRSTVWKGKNLKSSGIGSLTATDYGCPWLGSRQAPIPRRLKITTTKATKTAGG
jgi:hypothetical protein